MSNVYQNIFYLSDENEFKYCHVLACLKSLALPFPRPLPPINWVSILTPFLQQNEGLYLLNFPSFYI